MSSLSKKGLKLKTPLRTPSHPDPCIPKSFKEKNTGISYWSNSNPALVVRPLWRHFFCLYVRNCTNLCGAVGIIISG